MNLSYISTILLIFFSCQQSDRIPDVSQINVNLSVIRYEQELFEADTLLIDNTLSGLMNRYPEFTDVFLNQIIADPNYGNDVTASASAFVRDSFIRSLYVTSNTKYRDFSTYERELIEAFRFFKYYFPDKPVPGIYTCISGFDVGSFTVGDSILGIGLDFYLGPDFPYHPGLFPSYIKEFMTSEYLVAKSIHALVINYAGETEGTRLLDFMIGNGIELYIKKKLLPASSDEIIYEYSTAQMEWLKANESQIWAHLIHENLLHSVNYRSFQKMVDPSPNVPNMPPDAPGRLGNWIGAQIIESYMTRNPECTFSELFEIKDAQKILTESKYKPRQ